MRAQHAAVGTTLTPINLTRRPNRECIGQIACDGRVQEGSPGSEAAGGNRGGNTAFSHMSWLNKKSVHTARGLTI